MVKEKQDPKFWQQVLPDDEQTGPRGFTLIEILLVIAIFSVGILGTMSMQLAAGRTNGNARESALAMEYATDTMEQLMRVGCTDGGDDDGNGDIDDGEDMWGMADLAAGGPYTRGGDIPVNVYYNGIFNLTWNVTDLNVDGDNTTGAGPGGTEAKQIDITVTWDNGTKRIDLSSTRVEVLFQGT